MSPSATRPTETQGPDIDAIRSILTEVAIAAGIICGPIDRSINEFVNCVARSMRHRDESRAGCETVVASYALHQTRLNCALAVYTATNPNDRSGNKLFKAAEAYLLQEWSVDDVVNGLGDENEEDV